jgi:hypothetical protein
MRTFVSNGFLHKGWVLSGLAFPHQQRCQLKANTLQPGQSGHHRCFRLLTARRNCRIPLAFERRNLLHNQFETNKQPVRLVISANRALIPDSDLLDLGICLLYQILADLLRVLLSHRLKKLLQPRPFFRRKFGDHHPFLFQVRENFEGVPEE